MWAPVRGDKGCRLGDISYGGAPRPPIGGVLVRTIESDPPGRVCPADHISYIRLKGMTIETMVMVVRPHNR